MSRRVVGWVGDSELAAIEANAPALESGRQAVEALSAPNAERA
jgi:hypothetical protein